MSQTMKPSGVEWLGDIPQRWEVMPAKALFMQEKRPTRPDDEIITAFRDGQVTLRKNRRTTGFTEATNYDTYQGIRKGDLVIHQMDAFAGCAGISDSDGMGSPILIACTPRRGDIEPRYYAEIVRIMGHSGFISALAKGVRERSADFRFETFARQLLPLPPLPEQRAIANYLDAKCGAIDAAIAEAKKGIEEYKAWKKSLIFEAVTGKKRVGVFNAEKQSRGEAEKLKPSGIPWIGDVPEGWKVCKTLHALCMPITDGPHTTPDLFDEGIPFVSAEAVSCGNGSIDFNHIRGYISEAFYNECCLKYIPKRDDIYMIKSGATTGRVAIVDTDRVFTIWSPLAVFRCNQQRAKPRYMFYYLQSFAYQGQVELAWSFGTQQNIGMRALEELKVVLPPLPEQQAIADYLDEKCAAIDAMVAEKEALIADLEAYKKSLIYEMVTGKRRLA